jgi:hypothetical protein
MQARCGWLCEVWAEVGAEALVGGFEPARRHESGDNLHAQRLWTADAAWQQLIGML